MKNVIKELTAVALALVTTSCATYHARLDAEKMSPNEKLIFSIMRKKDYLETPSAKVKDANNNILLAALKYNALRPYVACHGEPPECVSKYVYQGNQNLLGLNENLADQLVLKDSDKLACYYLYSIAGYNIWNNEGVHLPDMYGNATFKEMMTALKKCASMGIGSHIFTNYVNHRENEIKRYKESGKFKAIDALVDKKFEEDHKKIKEKEIDSAKAICSGVIVPKKINYRDFLKIKEISLSGCLKISARCLKWNIALMHRPAKCEWQQDNRNYCAGNWHNEISEITEHNISISPENTPIIASASCKFYKSIENR
ncbi:MAG: hypothetical protein ACYCR3_00530 [Acidithiobacillus sp.]